MGHMTLTNDDRDWLDQKFGEVHARITKTEQRQTEELYRVTTEQNGKLAEMKETIKVHLATPCKDVKGHEDNHHTIGVVKIIAAIGTIVGILGGIAALAAFYR